MTEMPLLILCISIDADIPCEANSTWLSAIGAGQTEFTLLNFVVLV